MSLPVKIEDILKGQVVEWERLEFKAGWNPEAVLHTMCAFANDFNNLGGGYLIVGIAEENGRPILPPVGLAASSLDGIQKELIGLGHKIQPEYHPLVEPCEIDGKYVLFIRAQGGQNRPYKAPIALTKDCRDYRYYIRRHSNTVEARGSILNELLSLSNNVPFDDRLNQNANLGDLNRELIISYLKQIGSALAEVAPTMDFEELCRKMNIANGSTEACHPLNAGLMFFNEEPEKFFPQTQIDIVEFPDGPGGDRFAEKIFKGPLEKQLRDALSYLQNQVLKTIVLKEPQRAESERAWNFPYAAVEEIVANAVYHRSYEIREPIEVRVEPDRMTITSHPGPDRSISLEDLKSGRLHARRYRNRRIGEFLKELDLTEGRGTGIPKVQRAMQDNGSPPAEFYTNGDRDYFTAILPIHPALLGGDLGDAPPPSSPQQKREQLILEFCRVPRRRAAIQQLIGLKDPKDVRKRYLSPLVEAGLLTMTDPSNPTSARQSYQTTNNGLEHLRKSVRAD
jgi:ATP-dependent DNA helicase RecG